MPDAAGVCQVRGRGFPSDLSREAIGCDAVTQVNDTQATTDLIAHTLESVRAAYQDISELAQHENGIRGVVQTARGTALIHDLRKELDQLNKVLPFKS